MSRVSKVSETVEKILREHPTTRDDDFLLYAFVLNSYGFSKNTSFWKIRGYVLSQTVPSMECVGRCRRKLQEAYEELRAIDPVEKGRRSRCPEYKEYARDMK